MAKEIVKKTDAELQKMLGEERKALRLFRFSISGSKIKNIKELERAAKEKKIQKIEGLGPTVEKNILKSIEFAKTSHERMPLGFALKSAEEVIEQLKNLKDAKRINIAGSARRMKETVGDLDIIATSKNPAKVIEFFTKLPQVERILAKGDTKSSIVEDLLESKPEKTP